MSEIDKKELIAAADDINATKNHNPSDFVWSTATWKDWVYMRDKSYSGLLSKTLNCEYLTNSSNNVNNIHYQIPSYVHNSGLFPSRKLNFIILQLTEPLRDFDTRFEKQPNECSKEEFLELYGKISQLTLEEVDRANKLCSENNIHLLVWSWLDELAEVLKDKHYFIKLREGNKEWISFEDMQRDGKKVELSQSLKEYACTDGHPNKYFNQVLHDSIVIKLNSMGYNIN
tara:strand:- start:2851 stop:3537 length:687 start_codon:yes stop_codon:yes gene_type:complete